MHKSKREATMHSLNQQKNPTGIWLKQTHIQSESVLWH